MRSAFRTLPWLALALWSAPVASAQGVVSSGDRPGPDQAEIWLAELARVEQELEEMEAHTLRDPELQRLNQMLGMELEAAMEEEDPGLRADLLRVGTLERRARAAEAARDVATLERLATELRTMETRFERARAAALRRPGLAEQVELFHALLRIRMRADHADAARLLARFAELHRLLLETEAESFASGPRRS